MTMTLTEHAAAIEAAAAELQQRIDDAVTAVQEAPCPDKVDPSLWEGASLHVVDQLLVAAYNATEWAPSFALDRLRTLAQGRGEPQPVAEPTMESAEVAALKEIRCGDRLGWKPRAVHAAILQLQDARNALDASGFGKLFDATTKELDRLGVILRRALHDTLRVDGQKIPQQWLLYEVPRQERETAQ